MVVVVRDGGGVWVELGVAGGGGDGVHISSSMEVITNQALISDGYVCTNDRNLQYLHVQSQRGSTRHQMVACVWLFICILVYLN